MSLRDIGWGVLGAIGFPSTLQQEAHVQATWVRIAAMTSAPGRLERLVAEAKRRQLLGMDKLQAAESIADDVAAGRLG